MKVSELIQLLESHRSKHGDTYVSVRHAANHEFGPDDDLMDVTALSDSANNLFVIQVEN